MKVLWVVVRVCAGAARRGKVGSVVMVVAVVVAHRAAPRINSVWRVVGEGQRQQRRASIYSAPSFTRCLLRALYRCAARPL